MRGDTLGVFEKLFKKQIDVRAQEYFSMWNGYSPVFMDAPQSIYEMDITRTAVHSFAELCSKLTPDVIGSAKPYLQNILANRPNPFMTTSQFLYRLATILAVKNTVIILPVENERDGSLNGFYPIVPDGTEIIEHNGNPYLRYTSATGTRVAIEYERVGIMTRFQYQNDFYGETNGALNPTMQLINAQNQGIVAGIKNSAFIRFIGRIANVFDDKDIEKARQSFSTQNLSNENDSQIAIYDGKLADVKQIESKPFTVNALQWEHINQSVYNYFGTNKAILQNDYTEDTWNAYYEGKIEPFAIQASEVMTAMTYSNREMANKNKIMWTANRLQYASNQTKRAISTEFFDRGLFTLNQIMEIWNMPRVEDGDERWIRGEYMKMGDKEEGNANSEGTGIQSNVTAKSGANTETD